MMAWESETELDLVRESELAMDSVWESGSDSALASAPVSALELVQVLVLASELPLAPVLEWEWLRQF